MQRKDIETVPYGSNSYDQQSCASSSYDEARDFHWQEAKRKALAQLDRARLEPVAFTIKSNINYDPVIDDDSILHSLAISFRVKDFLHIKDKYDDDWWIGRLVKEGCDVGLIPSPMKLESLRLSQARPFSNLADDIDPEGEEVGSACVRNGIRPGKYKRKLYGKFQHPVAFDVVPSVRPIILIGPSLKGFEVTDMMQKAIFDFLKERFKNRVIITRVTADISLARQAEKLNPIGGGGSMKQGLIDRSNNDRLTSNFIEVTYEIERIFKLASTMQLIALDCDTINHPAQMARTSLAPILVYLKVASPKVLHRLIKSRGKGQARQINAQMSAAEKLSQLPNEMFDVILDENQLEDACDHLANYLESYWRSIHFPINSNSTNESTRSKACENNTRAGMPAQSSFMPAHLSHNHQETSLPNHHSTYYGQEVNYN